MPSSEPGAARPAGGVYVELPDWSREDFAFLAVEARCAGCNGTLSPGFNRREAAGDCSFEHEPFVGRGKEVDLVGDGSPSR